MALRDPRRSGRRQRTHGPQRRLHNTAILYNGRPHVFYWDNTDDTLRHAYYNGSFWAFEILDGKGGPNGRMNGGVGEEGAAILYNGRPHVFYRSDGIDSLRHAYYNGSAWAFETLDGQGGPNGRINADVGWENSVVLYNGRPHVFYYNSTNDTLRHAYYNGWAWIFETLDGAGGPNGRVSSDVGEYGAVILYNGRPHVFYHADALNSLRHAYYNGSAWIFETLDGQGGPNGRINATVGIDNAALLYNGRPHLFYYDANNGNLRHAYYNGSAWGFRDARRPTDPDPMVASTPTSAWRTRRSSTTAALGSSTTTTRTGTCATPTTTVRRGASRGSTEPVEPTVAPTSLSACSTPLSSYNGRPHVFYWDIDNADLRHAYFG
ncbi:MAG: hypothetical protein M5U31_16425 [Acidimicrobiia bacterium]|nr:hypothetical protein [Acidimicrobiia bacterium]